MPKAKERQFLITYYLFFYNASLFLIHLYIFLAILNSVQHRKSTIFSRFEILIKEKFVYAQQYPWLLLATGLQLLDLVHAILGWTKTSLSAGLVQIFGRLFVLWVTYYVELESPRWSSELLCLAYMSIELFR